MRTPDSDDTGTSQSGSLAEGFGVDDSDAGLETDDYGQGWPDGQDGSVGSTDPLDPSDGSSDGGLFPTSTEVDVEVDGTTDPFDPTEQATEDDFDYTGDGVVDAADLHEAVTSIFDFGIEAAASHGEGQPDDGVFDG
jgi:hypothetical protein